MVERTRRSCSPALQAAQKKLEHLRRQHRANKALTGPLTAAHGRSPHPTRKRSAAASSLSANHLGWESSALSEALKRRFAADSAGQQQGHLHDHKKIHPPQNDAEGTAAASQAPGTSGFVRLYPDLALAMLRYEEAAAGRIWLLLQYLDAHGCGWVGLSTARRWLTDKDSDFHVFGRRQFRKLLASGEGLFWHCDRERIWLRSSMKVAAALQVPRLIYRPVALPVASLLKGIGHLRAQLYASFHSSRNCSADDSGQGRPIARETLKKLTRVSRRSQQRYERRAAILREYNLAVGEISTVENDQRRAWQQGNAVFRFKDVAGIMGRKGAIYTAWQLPNNYLGPHETLPRGRQKKINRGLADLFMKGMTGNGKDSSRKPAYHRGNNGTDDRKLRRYHQHGQSAAASYSRSPERDAYWPERSNPIRGYTLWFLIPGQGGV